MSDLGFGGAQEVSARPKHGSLATEPAPPERRPVGPDHSTPPCHVPQAGNLPDVHVFDLQVPRHLGQHQLLDQHQPHNVLGIGIEGGGGVDRSSINIYRPLVRDSATFPSACLAIISQTLNTLPRPPSVPPFKPRTALLLPS